MSDQVSRFEDLERTDILPQLGFEPDESSNEWPNQRDGRIDQSARLAQLGKNAPAADLQKTQPHAVVPFGAQSKAAGGQLQILPAKPSTTDLAVGGIRGKIADLENRLLEAQDRQVDLARHCEQLTQRYRVTEERAVKAEAIYVAQAADLLRTTQRATDAEQRLTEQRVQLEAQIVDIERQLVDARIRAEKRTGTLEQLLKEQTDRASIGDRVFGDAKLEIEKLRAELTTAQATMRSLEERLEKQIQAATEISKLYARQTVEVSSFAEAMEKDKAALAELQVAKEDGDRRVSLLQDQLRVATDATANVQSELDLQKRHIAALESGLAHRDRSNDELKAHKASHEQAVQELHSTKVEMEKRCIDLQNSLAVVQTSLGDRDADVARLMAVVNNNERRILDLSAAQKIAEQQLRDRDSTLAAAGERAQVAQRELTQSSDQNRSLRERLDKQEQAIDNLQAQLQTRTAELAAAHARVAELENRQSEADSERQTRLAEFDGLQKTTQKLLAERDQLELENQAGRMELSRAEARYEEAVHTIVVVRESAAARDQQSAALERELRSTVQRLEEANANAARAASTIEKFEIALNERDDRIAQLEQKLIEHASALNAIGQDIERVNAANPSEKLAAMGYALESLDTPGIIHRITRMTTTAGRSNSNDIEINSTSVSRYHARIVVKPEGVWLIDLQSTNGCGVNGRRTSRQILCDGDAVRIGHCMFRFSVLGAEAINNVQADNNVKPVDQPPAQMLPPSGAEGRIQHH